MSPAIPYLTLPDLVILEAGALGGGFPPAPFAVKPFGTLVALGVYLGAYLAVRQGRRLGFDEKALVSFMVWVGVGGFVGGHVFDTLFYFPARVMEDPLSLLRVWEGLSSFGGFLGAAVGAILWKWKTNSVLLPYMMSSAVRFRWAGSWDAPGVRWLTIIPECSATPFWPSSTLTARASISGYTRCSSRSPLLWDF